MERTSSRLAWKTCEQVDFFLLRCLLHGTQYFRMVFMKLLRSSACRLLLALVAPSWDLFVTASVQAFREQLVEVTEHVAKGKKFSGRSATQQI